ncbi:recombinase family protein [Endozoicomonas sp.]|uniref:recombinase family protein n=1 Tax=Endozoicomonas sp. TaxID=1892382 RepID=UPI00383BAE2D
MTTPITMTKTAIATAITETVRIIYCYSYQRISSKKQLRGTGITRQLESSAAVCEEKGWTLDTTFRLTDIGKSAFHGRHLDDKAALGGFLKAVDDGLIKRPAVLLVESLDRLSRENIMDALELFIRILNTGISIYTTIDRITYNREDIKSNFGPLIISITILCRAHEESLIKSERTKKSWHYAAERLKAGGIGRSNIYPHWIDISSGKPLIIEKEANIIRSVFDLCIDENMSYAQITQHLVAKHGNKYRISPAGLKKLFTKKRVLGIYERNYEDIKSYPAIIEEARFYAAQAAIKNRIKRSNGRKTSSCLNFFKSLLKCGCCNAAVVISGSNSIYQSFRCNGRYRYKNCENKLTLSVKKFQPILIKAVACIDKDDLLASASNRKKLTLTKALNAKEAELEDKQTKIGNLAALVEAGSTTGVQRVVALESEINDLQQEMLSIQDQLDMMNSPILEASLDHINSFHQRFQLDKVSSEDQRPFIDAVSTTIEMIVINPSPEKGQLAIVNIRLLSGIELRLVVFKTYAALLYRGSKCLLRIEPRE